MKILIACEESQAVTIELRKLGHEAYSCDTLPCSGGYPEWHLQQDVTELLKKKWDMIIAFPPCTFLSKASACRLYPTAGNIDPVRYQKGVEAKEFFMQFLNADCDRIAVENPVSLKVFDMPQFTQEIEPYEYGHPFSKRTRLWLKGLPKLEPTNIVEKKGTYLPSSTSKNAYTGLNDKKTRCPKVASKTFQGIAKAMADQWTKEIQHKKSIQMKTEQQIRDYIKTLKKEKTKKGKPKKNIKKIKMLVELIKVVQNLPIEKVKNERQKLVDQLNKIDDLFPEYLLNFTDFRLADPTDHEKAVRKTFNNEFKRKNVRERLDNLNYLLY